MSILSRLGLFSRARRAAELDEEIRSHLALAEADRVRAGESLSHASRDVRREFGNVGLVKETTRDTWGGLWWDRLLQDLRYAARSLRRARGFSVVAVLTLGIGIGATTAMFTVVNGVLLRPLPFANPGQLFLVSYKPPHVDWLPHPALQDGAFMTYKARQRSFESIAVFQREPVTVTGGGDPERLSAAIVTPEFPGVLGVAPSLGSTFSPNDGKAGHAPVALISDRLWRQRFGGDPSAVGKPVAIDGVAHTIIGVMPAGFEFPDHAQLWRPFEVVLDSHNSWLRPVVGRLRPGVTLDQARAELAGMASQFPIVPGAERAELAAEIVPLNEIVIGNIRLALWVFAGAVAFLLLIACANVANLQLMRAASRQTEISVRAALGAGRRRLVRQLLTESVVVALFGGAFGVLLATIGIRALVTIVPAGRIPRLEELRVDMATLAFTVFISLITGILFGLAPAFRTTRVDLRDSLSQGARTVTARHGGLRAAFVMSEIALALILLAGAGLMIRSFVRMRSVDLGFQPEQSVSMTIDLPGSRYRTPESMQQFHRAVLDGLSAIPGVMATGGINWPPLGDNLIQGDFQVEGLTRPPGLIADKEVVSRGVFRALGIPIVSGRDFTDADNGGATAVAIISQSLAQRLWPNENAVGQRISLEDHPTARDWITIVGVAGDVVQRDVRSKPDAAIYTPYAQTHSLFFLSHMTFVVRSIANPSTIAAAMRGVLRDVDPSLPAQHLMAGEDLVASRIAEPLFEARLLGVFSAIALLLAAVGIYGVLAYSVAERTHEIGVRVALGARSADVTRMVLGRTLRLSVPGILIGLAGAAAVTRVLERLLFDVKPGDPATLLAVAVLLIVAAIVASLVPARRASRVDPAIALRAE